MSCNCRKTLGAVANVPPPTPVPPPGMQGTTKTLVVLGALGVAALAIFGRKVK